MEVHAHTHTALDPDSHRGRKKWTHYFPGFVILLFTVFIQTAVIAQKPSSAKSPDFVVLNKQFPDCIKTYPVRDRMDKTSKSGDFEEQFNK